MCYISVTVQKAQYSGCANSGDSGWWSLPRPEHLLALWQGKMVLGLMLDLKAFAQSWHKTVLHFIIKGNVKPQITVRGQGSLFLPHVPMRRTSSVVKNLPAGAGDLRLISGLGRSLGERIDKPLQYSCLGNLTNRGACQATVHDVTKVGCDLATKKQLNNTQPIRIIILRNMSSDSQN